VALHHFGLKSPDALQPQSLLGGKALLPDMMFPAVNRFNPRNVPLNPELGTPSHPNLCTSCFHLSTVLPSFL